MQEKERRQVLNMNQRTRELVLNSTENILKSYNEWCPDTVNTPGRVLKCWSELLDGYNVDIESLFYKSSGEGKDQIVAVRDIHSWSVCRHHMLQFSIVAHVAYLPGDCVVGVSKLERLVHAYAHRLQLQEKITREVAEAIMVNLKPRGVAVVLVGEHSCMRCRGVRSHTSQVVSSVMLGAFREETSTRMEVLALLGLRS